MNYQKQLISLLSILSLLGSSACLPIQPDSRAPKPAAEKSIAINTRTPKSIKVIDVPDIIKSYQDPDSLINAHGQAIKQASQKSELPSSLKLTPSPDKDHEVIDLHPIDDTANIANDISSLNLSATQGAKITPAALLKSVLKNSGASPRALTTLNDYYIKYQLDPNQQQLIQQARTLLVRAHPELVPGLQDKLAYLPNRFMSYFKEKMPTLSTTAGKQRFTQSVMMEALKDMPEFHNDTLANDLNLIARKYANDLTKISQLTNTDPSFLQMSMQWCRNLIIDIALLTPRTLNIAGKATAMTISGVAAAGIGAASGAIAGTGIGAFIGGIQGLQAGGPLTKNASNMIAHKEQYPGANGGKIGGYIGHAVGTPANIVGLGSIVGGTTGTATGAALGATTGAFNGAKNGALYGAQAGGQAFDAASNAISSRAQSASRVIYNQGAKLFQPKSSYDAASINSNYSTELQFSNVADTRSIENNSAHTNLNSQIDEPTASWYPESNQEDDFSEFEEIPL